MAKTYQDIYNSVFVTGNKMDFTNTIIRGNGIPLDIYSVFESYNSAVTFAATNAVAYEGEILAVTENGDTTVYVITPAKQGTVVINEVETDVYLKEVGKSTEGDNKTIVLNDGILSLKDFGEKYYKYYPAVAADEDNGIEAKEAYYELTTGWIDGLEPKVKKDSNGNFALAWYEPNPTTVDGLNKEITTIKENIGDINGDIEALSKTVTTLAQDTSKNFDTVNGQVDTLIGEDTGKSVRTIANEELAAQLIAEGAVEALDTLQEIAQWIQDHPEDASAMNKAIEDIEAILAGIGGTADTYKTVVEYVSAAIDALKIGDYAKVSDLTDLANGTVKDNTDAITGIKNGKTINDFASVETALENAIETLEGYTDEVVGDIGDKNVKTYVDDAKTQAIDTSGTNADTKISTHYTTVIKPEIEGLDSKIAQINNEETGILANSKKYTDEEIDKISNGVDGSLDLHITDEDKHLKGDERTRWEQAVTDASANKKAIEDINNEETGILKTAKDYVDTQIGTKPETIMDITFSGDVYSAITLIGNAAENNYEDIEAHTGNTLIHILESERQRWNEYYEDIRQLYDIDDSLSSRINAIANNKNEDGFNDFVTAQTYVDTEIAAAMSAVDSMTYKGTLGTDGTITELPTEGVDNGDTYKVISSYNKDGVIATTGDLIIAEKKADGFVWTVVPSGNDGDVYSTEDFTANTLMIATGTNSVKSYSGDIVGEVAGSTFTVSEGETETEYNEVVITTADAENSDITNDKKVSVAVQNLSTDKLVTGNLVLIFDGGNSGVDTEE